VPFKVAVTVPEPVIVAAVDDSTGTGVNRARKLASGACAAAATAGTSIATLAVTVPRVRTIDGIADILRWPSKLVKGDGGRSGGHLPGGNPGKWPQR
jgi:hypothetical protein